MKLAFAIALVAAALCAQERISLDGTWTVDGVGEKLGGYFAEREPIWGGFTVPPS